MKPLADSAKTNPIKPNFKPFTYKKLTKNAYFACDHQAVNGTAKRAKVRHSEGNVESDNVLLDEQLGTDGNTLSSVVKGEKNLLKHLLLMGQM